ncbi:MAG TPA: rod-binding protein [Treponemataceae bacterium]|nr:rod-binding protein [Treponemataceae bacterium]
MSALNGITSGTSSITNGYAVTANAKSQNEINAFQVLVEQAKKASANVSTLSTSAKNTSGRLNGDYTTGFSNTFTAESDKTATAQGFAANSGASTNKTIDKTSTLYEKSMELENYLVKMMLSSMRKTLHGTNINGEDKTYAQNMYEDMLYDQLSIEMTKQAGLGLADQIYLELA